MAQPLRHKPVALVAEASEEIRQRLRVLAEERGFEVTEAEDGARGVEAAKAQHPNLIFLALRLPEMNGLKALQAIREHDPEVPVVIVSTKTDRQTTERALALGAVNLIRKPIEEAEIQFVLDQIYRAIEEETGIRDVLDLVDQRETRLSFGSESGILSKVVAYLGRELKNGYPGFDIPLTEIKLALYEALANAFEHGNLEVGFDEKSKVLAVPGGITKLLEERLGDPRLAKRRIHVTVDYQPGRAVYRIRDEGRGFDPEAERTKPLAATTALHGRGLMLIRHYMDEVTWNETGNQIRLAKYLQPRRAARRRT
jgi:DNA-binding response OmpR family regulator